MQDQIVREACQWVLCSYNVASVRQCLDWDSQRYHVTGIRSRRKHKLDCLESESNGAAWPSLGTWLYTNDSCPSGDTSYKGNHALSMHIWNSDSWHRPWLWRAIEGPTVRDRDTSHITAEEWFKGCSQWGAKHNQARAPGNKASKTTSHTMLQRAPNTQHKEHGAQPLLGFTCFKPAGSSSLLTTVLTLLQPTFGAPCMSIFSFFRRTSSYFHDMTMIVTRVTLTSIRHLWHQAARCHCTPHRQALLGERWGRWVASVRWGVDGGYNQRFVPGHGWDGSGPNFLSFFLGSLITGLSGWRAPD